MKLLEKVIQLMLEAQKMDRLKTGEQKKKFVLSAIRSILEYPEPVEDLICDFIDIIIDVDKGKIKINQDIKKIFNCFKCQ